VSRSFRDIIMADELCDRLGVALAPGVQFSSTDPPGSGKTYIASRLIAALSGEVLIPYSVAVNDKIIRYSMRRARADRSFLEGNRRLLLARIRCAFRMCERPMIIVGGELTEDMLDVQFNGATAEYNASLQ